MPEKKIYRHYGLQPVLVAFLDEVSQERGVSKTQIIEEALHAQRYFWMNKHLIPKREPTLNPEIHTTKENPSHGN